MRVMLAPWTLRLGAAFSDRAHFGTASTFSSSTSGFSRPLFSLFKFSTIKVVQLGFNQTNIKGSIGFGDRAEEISFHTNQTYQLKQLFRYCSCSLTSLPSCTVRIMKPNRKFSGHFPVTQKTPGSKSVTNTPEKNVTSCQRIFKNRPLLFLVHIVHQHTKDEGSCDLLCSSFNCHSRCG